MCPGNRVNTTLTGHFDDHHAFLCRMMLERIDERPAGSRS
jgi:hypothetical protein